VLLPWRHRNKKIQPRQVRQDEDGESRSLRC